MTKAKILAELKGAPSPRVEQVGHLWQIGFAWVSGARTDGIGLARDLMAKWRNEGGVPEHATAKPIESPRSDPETDYKAMYEELMRNIHAEEPAPVEMPAFLKAPEMPPPDLADLIEYADTPVETNEKLLVRLREVLGLIGLAEDAGGRAAPDLYRRKDRLESGIRWNRGRLAGTI